jgi:putative aminopeptidase FrvX
VENLVKELTEAYGPSGEEEAVRRLVLDKVRGKADEVSLSPIGDVHAIFNKGGATRVMLVAHMDEIGVIVSHVDENGFARFHALGLFESEPLLGGRVRFANGAMGVIGAEEWQDRGKGLTLAQLFLDFGGSSRGDCPVKVGALGAFDRPFISLGKRWVAKALDDRLGIAILIETMQRLRRTPHLLQFVFTVQQEVGELGAHTSAYGLDPEIGLAVGVASTGDTPRAPKKAVRLGKGPAILARDTRMVSDPRLVNLIVQRAEAARIPYQIEISENGTTDASSIQLTRSGVPAATISVPCRYVHTPSEMVDREDVGNTVRLLLEILRNPIELNG